MTRHQVWKARERARFRLLAENVAVKRRGESPMDARWNAAALQYLSAKLDAQLRGITEPFLG